MDDKIKGLFPISQAAAVCGISRILQIQLFQSIGFNAKETSTYFTQDGEASELLAILEDKLSPLQRNVEELRIRAMTDFDMSVQMMTLPETVCCTRRCTLLTVQEKYDAMYHFFHECVENGYVPVRSESARNRHCGILYAGDISALS